MGTLCGEAVPISFLEVVLARDGFTPQFFTFQSNLMTEWAGTKHAAGEVIFGPGGSLKGNFHL